MKAIVWTKYGPPDVLQFKEVAKPTPKDNEVLIRIYAATVAIEDSMMRGSPPDPTPAFATCKIEPEIASVSSREKHPNGRYEH